MIRLWSEGLKHLNPIPVYPDYRVSIHMSKTEAQFDSKIVQDIFMPKFPFYNIHHTVALHEMEKHC